MKKYVNGLISGIFIVLGALSVFEIVDICTTVPPDGLFTILEIVRVYSLSGFLCGVFCMFGIDGLIHLFYECRSHFPRIDIKITKKGVNE